MSSFLKGLAGAVIGGILLYCALHVYWDHKDHHTLVNIVNQSLAAQQRVQPQQPTSPAKPEEKKDDSKK